MTGERRRTVDILGVRVDDVTTDEALERMGAWARESRPRHIVTVNPEFVMRAQRDEAFRVVLSAADMALPDGYGLLWAAKVLGQRLRERVTGSDTLPLLASLSAQEGLSVFLLGAAPGVAAAAATELRERCPGLVVAGTFSGSPDPAMDDQIVALVCKARPDLLFVAYGAPQQDLWIRRNASRLGVPVSMGVGGALDFVSGQVPRAPHWMRERGLEWAFRLWVQPWRWRRMLALLGFILRVLGQALAQRTGIASRRE